MELHLWGRSAGGIPFRRRSTSVRNFYARIGGLLVDSAVRAGGSSATAADGVRVLTHD